MNKTSSQSFDQVQHSDIVVDDNFENDDLVTFQHDSKTIQLFYSQLIKYSKHIRETYLFSDAINRFPQEIHRYQNEFKLLPENIDFFFQLLEQNYNINDDLNLTYTQCVDLLKMSKILEIRKLSTKIDKYINTHNIEVDFIIQMIQYDIQTRTETNNSEIEIKINNEMENLLTSKINECLSNEKFKELPIQIIFRVIKKSSPNIIDNNKLFDIIIKSLSKFCVLFPFVELQKLSEDRLEELCSIYLKSNEDTKQYFDFLNCNLTFINEINKHKKNLQNQLNETKEINDEQRNQMKDLETKMALLQTQFNNSEQTNAQLQNRLNETKEINDEQRNQMKDLETKMALLQTQFNNSEQTNSQLQNQLNETKEMNEQQESKMKDLENQISQLQNKLATSEKQVSDMSKQLRELLIEGRIVTSVEKGLLINAEINLKIKSGTLDTTKSKVIVSTSEVKYLGSEAYEKGEPITSLNMKTTFICKPGKYYVRCIVFTNEGESNEIISNSLTTSENSLRFDYEGKPTKISLPTGQYKLEVWGAKGGDSTGKGYVGGGYRGNSTVQGGLGGYSRGILKLNKKEIVYVFVGEEGRPSNSSDGSSTKGGFPDGGGTKTGHFFSHTTVPGTGGGSTSIRIGSDSDYSRVIVAGGGGGASGDSYCTDPGGFGGGMNGGNCYYVNSLHNQGAGTQTGSTCGYGDTPGDPGIFASGATGKYCQNGNSGGGGGGGWYGGGSGGCGVPNSSSGGGGSGWIFTMSSLRAFQSGDSTNSSKYALDSAFYLTDAKCMGGNEEFPRPDGNGNEKGHNGNGYAIITPL